jgi:hypothetical protein
MAMGLLLGALSLSGCNSPSGQSKAEPLVCIPGADRLRTFQEALAVLGSMYFSIDKADPKTGVIRTHPLPGGQVFEFWRSDNVTLRNQVEANLHSLRRTVWVTVQPQVGSDVSVDCLVKVQRLNVPSEAVSSSATAYRTLSESTIYGQSLKLSPEQQKAMEWVDIGNDPALAKRIIKRIEARLKHNARHKTPKKVNG